MNINYEIRETADYGKGIYALEDIPAGTCVWLYNLGKNVFEYDEGACQRHLSALPNLSAQQNFLDYSFGKGELLCLITDDGQYMNHADASTCNCKTDLQTGHCFAIRPIKIEEQLFEDYATFSHPSFLYKLLHQYECEPKYYDLPSKTNN